MSEQKPTYLRPVVVPHPPIHLGDFQSLGQPMHGAVRKAAATTALAIAEKVVVLREVRGRLCTCSSIADVRDLLTSMIVERDTRLDAVANG